jgi:hypothetical protein
MASFSISDGETSGSASSIGRLFSYIDVSKW